MRRLKEMRRQGARPVAYRIEFTRAARKAAATKIRIPHSAIGST